jgi:3-oxoacyl-[acyl-carrier protein] reductase
VSRFTDKLAAVTGAAGGIGADPARRLASEGAALALIDLTAAQHAVDEIAQTGASA